jgi:hypothetical protein
VVSIGDSEEYKARSGVERAAEEDWTMMTNRDLNYLKRATPADLMKLTNGIPWEFCSMIKVLLTSSKTLTFEQLREPVKIEQRKWIAAGAVPNDLAEHQRWVNERSNVLKPCDECGKTKQANPGRRFTFSRDHGFGWHNLCGSCKQDFDCHHYPSKLAELAARWQGRCFRRREVAQ